MKRVILVLLILTSFLYSEDGYIQLSKLTEDSLKQNNFVALDKVLNETDEWVSLSTVEEKINSINSFEDNIEIIAYDEIQNDEYIALSVYDQSLEVAETQNKEYVALDEMQDDSEEVLAIYDAAMEAEEKYFAMAFDF